MRLYDVAGRIVSDIPKRVFRGFDINKDNSDALSQIERILKRGNLPSQALLIKEGSFDFKRMRDQNSACTQLTRRHIKKYVRMLDGGKLDSSDIDNDLRYHHLVYLPTPLVSVSTDIRVGARYSHWFLRPVLIFQTDGLDGLDLRNERGTDSEIGVFGVLPVTNLSGVIYFFEDQKTLRTLLNDYGKSDVKLHKGFVRPDFSYRTLSGDKRFNVPFNLMYDDAFLDFYETLEKRLN